MNLEPLIPFLQNNHFYAASITRNKKKEVEKIEVACSPITIDDKKKRLEEILEGKGVVVHAERKNQCLVIRTKK